MYLPILTETQKLLPRAIFEPLRRPLRKHNPFDILEAISYVAVTGCQWKRLPPGYPPATTVYYHFRAWNERTNLSEVFRILVTMKRESAGQRGEPTAIVIDSQRHDVVELHTDDVMQVITPPLTDRFRRQSGGYRCVHKYKKIRKRSRKSIIITLVRF